MISRIIRFNSQPAITDKYSVNRSILLKLKFSQALYSCEAKSRRATISPSQELNCLSAYVSTMNWWLRNGLIIYDQYHRTLSHYRNLPQKQAESEERIKTLLGLAFTVRVLAYAMKMIHAKKYFCAPSMSFGGLTTFFLQELVLLTVGIPVLVWGALFAVGPCSHEKIWAYCKEKNCCESEESYVSTNEITNPSAVTTQPGRTRTTNSDCDGSETESDEREIFEHKADSSV